MVQQQQQQALVLQQAAQGLVGLWSWGTLLQAPQGRHQQQQQRQAAQAETGMPCSRLISPTLALCRCRTGVSKCWAGAALAVLHYCSTASAAGWWG